jgi:LPXTG-motif cell wall-anchored protein
MIVPSLYANKAFYDSTSALSGNPFSDNSTCGMSGTLKDCGLAAFPGGNIGYANRIEGVNGWFDIFSEFAGNVIDRAAPVLNQAFDALLGQGQTKVLEAAGYKMLGPVTTIVNGVEEAGIKAQKKDGSFIILLKGFREVPFTSAVAAQTRTVDPKTGLTTGQTLGIGVGVVAAVALLFFFMSKRR